MASSFLNNNGPKDDEKPEEAGASDSEQESDDDDIPLVALRSSRRLTQKMPSKKDESNGGQHSDKSDDNGNESDDDDASDKSYHSGNESDSDDASDKSDHSGKESNSDDASINIDHSGNESDSNVASSEQEKVDPNNAVGPSFQDRLVQFMPNQKMSSVEGRAIQCAITYEAGVRARRDQSRYYGIMPKPMRYKLSKKHYADVLEEIDESYMSKEQKRTMRYKRLNQQNGEYVDGYYLWNLFIMIGMYIRSCTIPLLPKHIASPSMSETEIEEAFEKARLELDSVFTEERYEIAVTLTARIFRTSPHLHLDDKKREINKVRLEAEKQKNIPRLAKALMKRTVVARKQETGKGKGVLKTKTREGLEPGSSVEIAGKGSGGEKINNEVDRALDAQNDVHFSNEARGQVVHQLEPVDGQQIEIMKKEDEVWEEEQKAWEEEKKVAFPTKKKRNKPEERKRYKEKLAEIEKEEEKNRAKCEKQENIKRIIAEECATLMDGFSYFEPPPHTISVPLPMSPCRCKHCFKSNGTRRLFKRKETYYKYRGHQVSVKYYNVTEMYHVWYGLGHYTDLPLPGGINALEKEPSQWRNVGPQPHEEQISDGWKKVLKVIALRTIVEAVVDRQNVSGKSLEIVLEEFDQLWKDAGGKRMGRLTQKLKAKQFIEEERQQRSLTIDPPVGHQEYCSLVAASDSLKYLRESDDQQPSIFLRKKKKKRILRLAAKQFFEEEETQRESGDLQPRNLSRKKKRIKVH